MVNEKINKVLLSLSEADREIFSVLGRKGEVEATINKFETELEMRRKQLAELEAAAKEGTTRQVLEEHRLQDEQQKIMERRRQLTTIGGAKVGKIMEREIDIAGKALQSLEERAMKAVEEADQLGTQVDEMQAAVKEIEEEYKSTAPEHEKVIKECDKELKGLNKQRETLYKKLDERLQRLYARVQGRYPDGAVAPTTKGACRSCFRALPAQTYNQVMAGNMLIQCPGCMRILVYVPGAEEPGEERSRAFRLCLLPPKSLLNNFLPELVR